MLKRIGFFVFALFIIFACVSSAEARVTNPKTLLEAEVKVVRDKIAAMTEKDPEKALQASIEMLAELNRPKYLLLFSKSERNAFKEQILRNELYNAANKAGQYGAAANAVREASDIKKDGNDAKLIVEANQKQSKQKEMFNAEQASLKKSEAIADKKIDLAKQKEDLLKSYKSKNNLSKTDLSALNAKVSAIDSQIAAQDKLLADEQKNYAALVTAREGTGIVLNEKQNKDIKSEKSDIEKNQKKFNKQEKENREIVGRVVGNYYFQQQIASYNNTDRIYGKMLDLAKQKLALIIAANLKREPTKDYLDALKAKMAAMDAQIAAFKKELDQEKANLKAIKAALKAEGGEYSLLQKSAILLREARGPKDALAFNIVNKDMTKAIAKLVEKFEVSWNGLEEAIKNLSALQDEILALHKSLLEYSAKAPLSADDIAKIREMKAKLDALLAKEAEMYEKVELSFTSADSFFDLKKGEREKFNKLFNTVFEKNNSIHGTSPSFDELFTKLLAPGTEVTPDQGSNTGSEDTSTSDDSSSDDNSNTGSNTGSNDNSNTGNNSNDGSNAGDDANNRRTVTDKDLEAASGMFKNTAAAKTVVYSDENVTIMDFFDSAKKYIGTMIRIGNKVIWKDASGNNLTGEEDEDEADTDDEASDDAAEPANEVPADTTTTDDATTADDADDNGVAPASNGTPVDRHERSHPKKDPQNLLETL